MNKKKHLLIGVLLLFSAVYMSYVLFDTIIRYEDYPNSMFDDGTGTEEPIVHYLNPLTYLLVGEVELSEGYSMVPSFPGRFAAFINIILLALYLKHAVAQLRGKPMTPFTRMLVVVPTITLLSIFVVIIQNTLLDYPSSFFSSPQWLISAALGVVGLAAVLLYAKPDSEEPLVEGYMSEAPMGIRFIHQILDRSVLILFFFLPFLGLIVYSYTSSNYSSDSDPGTMELARDLVFLGISVLIALTIGLFEGVSHWSPAKWMTGYQVRTKDKQSIRFGSALLRSVCRLIPFDAWSFLFRGNWHDRISGTTVHYHSTTPWIVKQTTWMRKTASVVAVASLVGFVAMVLDLCVEERVLHLGSFFDSKDFFNFYWQLPLVLIALFIPLQAGFSAALMYHAECMWDKEASDKASYLFTTLFAWVPLLGWLLSSRSTSDVEYAYEKTHAEHSHLRPFSNRARSVRGAMHLYHILFTLALLGIFAEGWSLMMLLSLAFVLLLAMTVYTFSWLRYVKALGVLGELKATTEN